MPASKIAINGAKLIKNGMTIFTYCYSTTVIAILQTAHQQGKKFQVICSETRPNFTGRLTAKALAKIGIPTSITVDSMSFINLQQADLFLFGADYFLKNRIINKLGTNAIIQLAKLTKTPTYCCTNTEKFQPKKLPASKLKTKTIGARPIKEVWSSPPKNLTIISPAYDCTLLSDVSGIITEVGILKTKDPHVLQKVIAQKSY